MVKEFHVRNKYDHSAKKQVQEKEGQLKRDYKMLKEARKQSGGSWNEKRCMIEASPTLWENLKITFPKIGKFHNNKATFPLYDALGELYDGYLVEGNHNCTSLDSMEDDEPLRLVQELEESELEETEVLLLERNSREKENDVVLLEDPRNSREEENDVVLLEDPRNPREKETRAEDSRVVTEEQRRRALIEYRRKEKEDKKAQKASKNSSVESMLERYLEMRSKQAEDEVASREKESSQAADYSVKKSVSMLNSMDVTKEEKAKAYAVFKTPTNREVFLCACEHDLESALIWLRSEMA